MHHPFGPRILKCRDPSADDLRHFAACRLAETTDLRSRSERMVNLALWLCMFQPRHG